MTPTLALLASVLVAAPPSVRELPLGRTVVALRPTDLVYTADLRGDDALRDWSVESGTWHATSEGLRGTSASEGAAATWCTRSFPFDVAVRVIGRTVPPHANDLNVYTCGTGSLRGEGDHACYIAGLFGWWTSRHGLERYPAGWSSTRPAPRSRPGRRHEIVTGRLGAQVFLFVDGEEVVTTTDSDPLPAATHDRIGLATWNSEVLFERVEVYRIGPP